MREQAREQAEISKQAPDNFPDDLDVQAFNDYEGTLARSISDMEQRRKGQAQDSLPPFEAAAHRSLEESLHRLYEQHTGKQRPADDPKSPGQEKDE